MNPVYIEAFRRWSGSKGDDFYYKEIGDHVAFLYKGETYMISTFDAFRRDLKAYFENKSYDELYCQVNEGLWNYLFETEEVNISTGDLIVALFNEWRSYWYEKWEEHSQTKDRIKEMKNESYKDLLILIEAIKAESSKVVRYASDIDGLVFIPLVALIAKENWGDDEDFYDTLVSRLVDQGDQLVTMGDTFDEVDVMTDKGIETFYIYNPSWELEESEVKPAVSKRGKKG